MQIDASIRKDIDYEKLNNYSIKENNKHISVQLFFAREGKIKIMSEREEIKKLRGVYNVGFNYKIGQRINEIENASQRAGYIIVYGNSKSNLEANLQNIYSKFIMQDEFNNNMLIFNKISYK